MALYRVSRMLRSSRTSADEPEIGSTRCPVEACREGDVVEHATIAERARMPAPRRWPGRRDASSDRHLALDVTSQCDPVFDLLPHRHGARRPHVDVDAPLRGVRTTRSDPHRVPALGRARARHRRLPRARPWAGPPSAAARAVRRREPPVAPARDVMPLGPVDIHDANLRTQVRLETLVILVTIVVLGTLVARPQ